MVYYDEDERMRSLMDALPEEEISSVEGYFPQAVKKPIKQEGSTAVAGVKGTTQQSSVGETVKQRIADGESPFTALFQKNSKEPQKDKDKEKKLKKMAKIQAYTNALATLGSAIGAFAGKGGLSRGNFAGYFPNVNREGVGAYLNEIDQMEEDYKTEHNKWMDNKTAAEMRDLQYQLSKLEKEKAEQKAKEALAEQRTYTEGQRDEERQYAEAQEAKKREMALMDTAIEWGVFSGDFEEWNKLTPKRRSELIAQAAEKKRKYNLTPKPSSDTPKLEDTIVLPLSNGQSMAVPKGQMSNANWEAVYLAMVKENSAHQAIGNPKYNAYGDLIGYYPPTVSQKIAAIQEHFASSPGAQKEVEKIIGARGQKGVVEAPTSSTPKPATTSIDSPWIKK